jgi:hypothetical protein
MFKIQYLYFIWTDVELDFLKSDYGFALILYRSMPRRILSRDMWDLNIFMYLLASF